MIETGAFFRSAFAAFLCMAVVVWSLMPSLAHASNVFDAVQDHLEVIEDHGHSHGFEEDLYWAMHGHSHDAVDHDHSQAFLSTNQRSVPFETFSEVMLRMESTDDPTRFSRIDRPPRG